MLQGVTSGDKGLQKLQGFKGMTKSFRDLQRVTRGYKGLKGLTTGNRVFQELQGVRSDDGITKDYWG